MASKSPNRLGNSLARPTLGHRRISEFENIQLSRARWATHRKKIGLRRRVTDFPESILASYDERQSKFIEFIQTNINRKECSHFVPKHVLSRQQGAPILCHCGEAPERHIEGTDGVTEIFRKGIITIEKDLADPESEMSRLKWQSSQDVIERPSNAFGKIDFISGDMEGRKPARFVRLADSTPMDHVVSLLVDHWNLFHPRPANLVITIVGGGRNFKLVGKKREIFNRGLIKATQTTAGWVITSGLNMGVVKAVGEAVREGQSYNYEHTGIGHSFHCIGIAPWGFVEGRHQLISKDGNGSWPASHKVNSVVRRGQPASLNPYHTHFLLVDDGNRGKNSGVADFRAALERKIFSPPTGKQGGLGIPVVLVLVEGGCDALEDVRKSLSQGIPVVICEGTGRAADIIAYAYGHYVRMRNGERRLSAKHKLILENKLREAFGQTWTQLEDETAEIEKFMSLVLMSCEDEKLITVFDMNKHADFDLAILSALLKGQGATDIGQMKEQLQIALSWNRCDVAAEKIFKDNITWPNGYLDDVMTQALLGDKVNFVRLLLQNGVIMKEYLTVPRLRKLYNSAPQNSHIRKLLQKSSKRAIFTLRDVDQLLRRLGSKHTNDLYRGDSALHQVIFDEDWCKGPQSEFANPSLELFIWAVLMQRQEMAVFLWEHGTEALPSAIMASRIYGALAGRVTSYDSDLRNLYMQNKKEFEMMATGVLEVCHKVDSDKAGMLIERRYSTWGDMNCLEMAALAESQMFLSSVCCQNSLNLMWKRGINSSAFKIILGILCPIVILTNVRFQDFDDFTSGQFSVGQKLVTFYRAPATKYVFHVMMYLVFLVFYSFMCLFSVRDTPTPWECFMLGWIFTFACEEIRAMFFDSKADSIKERIRDWWNFSYYNRLDILTILLAFTGALMRLDPAYTPAALVVYSLNCILFYIRVLREYSASSNLGPKLVMIVKMFKELVLYIMILMVVLLAYGVSTQALMHPQRSFYPGIFHDIVYYPYWQIYGELYLDELEGRTSECQGNLTAAQEADCPRYTILVPLLTGAYLLIGNILLLNLLIAIFNHVFEEVEMNSIQVWKYGMYYLVVDYDNKPCLPPPLIIFEHMFLVVKWIVRHTCRIKKVATKQYTTRQIQLLQLFEKEMLRVYLRKRQQGDRSSTDSNIINIMHRVDEMAKLLEEEKILEQQNMGSLRGGSSLQFGTWFSGSEDADTMTPRKATRWPTLDRLRKLKDGMPIIEENEDHEDEEIDELDNDRMRRTGEFEDSSTYTPEGDEHDVTRYKNILEQVDHEDQNIAELDSGRMRCNAAFDDPSTDESLGDEIDHRRYKVSLPGPGTDPNINRLTASKNFDLCKEIVYRNHVDRKKRESKTKCKIETSQDEHGTKKKRKKLKKKKRKHSSKSRDGIVWNKLSDSSDGEECGARRNQDSLDRKQMNISPFGSHSRDTIEERLARLEETTERKLHNIEVLLRDAVFANSTGQSHVDGNNPT